ncbi:hypothetical protein N3K63_06490 [Microbacterium sp. W1N]|uniref:hypothetical protein n=1 Tax=Microbacterium festucae TaxID=2977531 RepID=UPI0021BF1283|nr:hypothetical protein [Microbacterium festucae]MCT9819936.1 hypothetical protein [Microbacterium festucae]
MLALILALSIALAGPVTTNAAESCEGGMGWSGDCSVTNTGSSVDLSGTRPGGGSGERGDSGSGDQPARPRDSADDPVDPRNPSGNLVCTEGLGCRGGYEVVVFRPTMNDVASFAPTARPLVDEPDGVGIVGMPVNFVVDAETHAATGTLFELPVTVRFTPVSYRFAHGDGTSRTASGGGATWAELGLAQFSATATSHAYAARGTYTASTAVEYSAAVDFGSGWIDVPGTLTIPGGTATLQIVEARTALVDRTCLEDPSGPGC